MTETGRIIKSLMAQHDLKSYQLADKLGISEPTLRARFKDGRFRVREIELLIEILNIKNPWDVFFKLNMVEGDDE